MVNHCDTFWRFQCPTVSMIEFQRDRKEPEPWMAFYYCIAWLLHMGLCMSLNHPSMIPPQKRSMVTQIWPTFTTPPPVMCCHGAGSWPRSVEGSSHSKHISVRAPALNRVISMLLGSEWPQHKVALFSVGRFLCPSCADKTKGVSWHRRRTRRRNREFICGFKT